jgi:hypothetical protein
MRNIVLITLLFSINCFSQVYRFNNKSVRKANSWKVVNVQGYVTINDCEIVIVENNKRINFIIYKIIPFGDEYVIYDCIDVDKKKLKIVTEGANRNKTHFQILISYPSKYWKYTITKI